MRRKIFRFKFDGLALGGEAVVVATSLEEAKGLLKHETNVELSGPEEGEPLPSGAFVVHYWNGDY